jgi:hypothetical protein
MNRQMRKQNWLTALAVLLFLFGLGRALPAQEEEPPEEPAEIEVETPPPAEETEEAEPEAVEVAEESVYLAIVGGDIHSVTDGVTRKGIVLCKNGRILKVGRRVRIPKDARVIDATGMRVYPGLIAVDTSGFMRGSGASSRDGFDPFSLMVDLGLAGGLTTVHGSQAIGKLTRGSLEGMLVGTTPWVRLSWSSTSPSGRRSLRASFQIVRDYLRVERAQALDKELGEEVDELKEPKGLNKDHLRLLRGEAMARFSANSLKDLSGICDLLEEFPMQSVIFGGREAWACAGRLGRVNARLVLTPRSKQMADKRVNRPSGWSIENARKLWDAGVEFAILPSQKYISTGGIAGRDLLTLPMEAAFAIRGGLPQKAALRAITLDAAKILGMADRLGSIQVGKDADLIICDGDIFDYRTFVQWAVVNGAVVYDKQAMPYFAHIRPRPEPQKVIEAITDALKGDKVEEESAPTEGGEADAPEASVTPAESSTKKELQD